MSYDIMDYVYDCYDGMRPDRRYEALSDLIAEIELYRDTIEEQEAMDDGDADEVNDDE